jgi:hypothetical protein
MSFESSPVSVEWEEEVSANCVQEDDVEDDEVNDTNGRFLGRYGAFMGLVKLSKGSNAPVKLIIKYC